MRIFHSVPQKIYPITLYCIAPKGCCFIFQCFTFTPTDYMLKELQADGLENVHGEKVHVSSDI